jgi:ABC-type amino acid transport substrate-binding protein
MKKNLVQFSLTVSILFFSLTSFSQTYKIGCVDDYYPYTTTNNNGKLEGILIDWWNLWSEKAGVDIEFVSLDTQGIIDKAKTGEIDAIAGIFYSDKRAEHIDFSEPLIRLKTVVYLNKDIKIDSFQNFKGTLNLVEHTLAESFVQNKYQDIKLNTFKSYAALTQAVFLKNVDAFVYDIPNPTGNFKAPPPPDGYYLLETLFTEKLRPAVVKGNNQLGKLIVSGASKISDEELIELVKKWDFFEKDRTQLWWFIGLGAGLLLIIVILIIQSTKIRKKSKNSTSLSSKTNWQGIIEKGENDLIEFKSSLWWDYRQEKINKTLELVIVKTISAFLNTIGGTLFIGVDDEGKALGLEMDYGRMSKNNRDGFLLTLTNLINRHLGKNTHMFIRVTIISINNKDVCVISIEKSDKPIFLGKNEKEEFYIRASASSQPLGIEESYKYIKSHWKE